MERSAKTAAILSILIVFSFVSHSQQEKKKKVDCRKHVYAPVCRGIQARNDLPAYKFERLPLLRDPRAKLASSDLDLEQWKNKDKETYYETPVSTSFQKWENGDYEE